ncbi:hypothetical protein ACFYXS_19860 [Streptomyces sp. NPDC002574]|uniref:hypothetical protein n=1 Tax=Streptomyces sp. NPDC002574 TaxID=3364652 RepID=UPI003691CE80
MDWRRAVAAASAVVAGLGVTGAAAPGPGPSASPTAGLAGSVPGEGRRHPGRPERPPVEPSGQPVSQGPQQVFDDGETSGPEAVPSPTGRVLEVLPLGAGLLLIGLGLGFLGWRLRRGR